MSQLVCCTQQDCGSAENRQGPRQVPKPKTSRDLLGGVLHHRHQLLDPGARRAGTSDRTRSSRRSRRRAALRIGAAIAVSPTSSSSTATAYPCSRTSASSRRSWAFVVTRLGGVATAAAGSRLSTSSPDEAGEQHLAVGGGVQRDVLADPVVRLERGRAGDLVEVERGAVGEHRDVDRLPGVGRELAADRPRLLDHVEAGGRRAGEPQHPDAEAVLAALLVLLDQAVGLQRGDQPERRALVHAELDGDLGDPRLAEPGQDLQDREGPVDRLDRCRRLTGARVGQLLLMTDPSADACCVSQNVSLLTQRTDASTRRAMRQRALTDQATSSYPRLPRPARHRARGDGLPGRAAAATSWRASSSATAPSTGSSCGCSSRVDRDGDASSRCGRPSPRWPSGSGMAWELWAAAAPYRTLIMVSKFSHCLNDLLFRWSTGSLQIDIAGDRVQPPRLRGAGPKSYGVPFHHVPVTPETKADAEATADVAGGRPRHPPRRAGPLHAGALRRRCAARCPARAINIHHSFLPSFKGARPYHQAFDRGVKLVGATAHYVTADLDEGPIIEQDVMRVDHGYDADAARRRRPRRGEPGAVPGGPLARRVPGPAQRPQDRRLPLSPARRFTGCPVNRAAPPPLQRSGCDCFVGARSCTSIATRRHSRRSPATRPRQPGAGAAASAADTGRLRVLTQATHVPTLPVMDDYFLGVEARQGFIARADVLSCGFDDRFIRRQLSSKAWTGSARAPTASRSRGRPRRRRTSSPARACRAPLAR